MSDIHNLPNPDVDAPDPEDAHFATHPHHFAEDGDFGDPTVSDIHHTSDHRAVFDDYTSDPSDPLNLLVSELMHGGDAGASAISSGTTHAVSAAAAVNLVRAGQSARAASVADMDVPDADEEDEPQEEYIGVGVGLFLPLNELGMASHAPVEHRGLRISDAAWSDLRDAAQAIATQYGPASAEQFLIHLEAVINALRVSPTALGTPRPPADFNHDPNLTHLYVYYVSTGPYPCDVFYRCLPDPDGTGPERARAEVLRVLHGSVEQPWLFPDAPLWEGDE